MREQFYDELSSLVDWHWWYQGRKKIVFSCLEKYKKNGGEKILDIGCGVGGMLGALDRYGKTCGIDNSFKSISICRKKGFPNTCFSNVTNLPFKDGKFSLVSILDVIEHVDDDKNVMREVSRVCKPGGLVLLTVPAFQFLWGNIDIVTHHKRRYTAKGLRDVLRGSELRVDYLTYFNFLLFPLIAALRISDRLLFNRFKNEETMKSDFTYNKPGVMNNLLTLLFSVESRILSLCKVPFGVSILCILKKTEKQSQPISK